MENMGKKNAGVLLPLAILLLGLLCRALLFGELPGGINQDEAFAGYEAWCLLNYGTDTALYPFPVYLTAWGSGMNALESYMMIPFIALFGLEAWVIRLPQLIVAILSIWVCYLTVRKLRDEKTALAAMALLALCPWHIMLSRWGLESNLAPGFLLFGLYFFIKATENSRFLLLSALMYGLSLYCYATIWPIVPFLILAQVIYCLRKGLLKIDPYLFLSAALLFLLALPLLLFMAVNYGLIGEIRTEFMSIPKLLYMRSGEISLKNIPENLKNLFGLLSTQSDSLPWNSLGNFGFLYHLSLPFALLGLIDSLARCLKGGKDASFEPILLMQVLAGFLLGALVKVNANRINIIFIPLVMLTACGLHFFCGLFGKKAVIILLLAYALCFACFELSYFEDYPDEIGWYFDEGLEEALDAAAEHEGRVYLPGELHYPKVLFFTKTPLDEFTETVSYLRYPDPYLSAVSFDRYVFGFDPMWPEAGASYIIKQGTDLSAFIEAGFTLETWDNYTLAYTD